METITPSKALYIKLGTGGSWESDCLTRDQVIRLGYTNVPHQLCLNHHWIEVRDFLLANGTADLGAATRHTNQIREFYEANASVLWITFFGDRMWWCFSQPSIMQLPDDSKVRPAIGEWHSTDIAGTPLQKNRISGKILSVEAYRGTICTIKEFDYLIKKINATSRKEVDEATAALTNLESKIEKLIQLLHWKDFEILNDLIFRQTGWQRVSILGEAEKLLDLDLISPITSERFGVQVKSKARMADFLDYQKRFEDMQGYRKLYFVVHTPSKDLQSLEQVTNADIELMLPSKIAHLSVKYGLADWVIERTS